MDGLIGRLGRHPETQFVLGFETRAHTKTHYHRYQLRTGTNRQCHGRMQSELWCVPLSSNTLSLSSRDVCAALSFHLARLRTAPRLLRSRLRLRRLQRMPFCWGLSGAVTSYGY